MDGWVDEWAHKQMKNSAWHLLINASHFYYHCSHPSPGWNNLDSAPSLPIKQSQSPWTVSGFPYPSSSKTYLPQQAPPEVSRPLTGTAVSSSGLSHRPFVWVNSSLLLMGESFWSPRLRALSCVLPLPPPCPHEPHCTSHRAAIPAFYVYMPVKGHRCWSVLQNLNTKRHMGPCLLPGMKQSRMFAVKQLQATLPQNR